MIEEAASGWVPLAEPITDDDMQDVIANNGLAQAAERLIDIANERGGDDNITAVLVEVEQLDDDEGDTLSGDSTIEA